MSRSNRLMHVRHPAWWSYPERYKNEHEQGPGPDHGVVVDVRLSPALAAGTRGPSEYPAVYWRAKGCRSVWYRPRHDTAAGA